MKQAKVLKIDLLSGKDGSDLLFHRFAIRHGLNALEPYLGAAPMPPEAAQGNVQSIQGSAGHQSDDYTFFFCADFGQAAYLWVHSILLYSCLPRHKTLEK